MNQRRSFLLTGLSAAWFALTTIGAPAMSGTPVRRPWPSRPLRLLAGGVGGVPDIRARWLAHRLGPRLGVPVVVENVPAAGGNVAAREVAAAHPDGHTLLLLHQGIAAINPHLYARTGYDPIRDLAPVTRFGHGPLLLVATPGSGLATAAQLMARARARPFDQNFASPGIGTPPHLAAELFLRAAGIQATHIPYRGGGAMATGLLGSEIDWAFEAVVAMLPLVRVGRLRALANTGEQRIAILPDVPTLTEAGVPGYHFDGWTGIGAPAATPAAVIDRLQQEIAAIGAEVETRDWFLANGAEAGILTPDAFGALIRSDYERFGKIIAAAGISVEADQR